MNVVDGVIVLFLFLAGSAGYGLGFIRRAAGWAGFAAGAVVGWQFAEAAARWVAAGIPVVRLFAAVGIVLAAGSIGGALGDALGGIIRRAVAPGPLRTLDAAAGAVAGVGAVLVGVWLAFPVLASMPGALAQQAHTSAVVGFVRDVAPEPPKSLKAFGSRLAKTRFPDISGLRRAPDLGQPPVDTGVPLAVIERVSKSTVSVEADGCGGRHEGSGWTTSEDVVVTNAHVVAGADRVRVRRPDQRVLAAAVVLFDEDRDIAVLEVPGLGQAPLPVASAAVGDRGVVIGYPGGRDRPVVSAAAIRREQPTVGPDIYGRGRVQRQVLFLAARLQQGDSGSPLVDPQGRVVGMAFAIAPDRQTTAYALDDSELRAALTAPRRGGTGSCI